MSLILSSSCSDPASVGIELAPGNNQVGVFFVDFELPAEVVLLDSFNTTNQGLLVVGNEQDPYFGKTTSTGYSRMYFTTSAVRPESQAILDSVIFDLDIISVNGQDLEEAKTFSIHRLTEPILDTMYYNFDELMYEATPLASSEFVFGEVTDTIVSMQAEEAFAEEVFEKLKRGEEFDNVFNFREYFPGIAVQGLESNNTTVGIDLGEGTKLSFYYRNDASDTISTSFNITTVSSRSFNGVKSDRSGTATEIVQDKNVAYSTGDLVGMKSNLGMVIRLDTSPIDPFLDTLSGVVFKQAELKIENYESVPEGQASPSFFVAYFTDFSNDFLTRSDGQPLTVQRDGQPQVVEMEDGTEEPAVSVPAVGVINTEDEEYSMAITSHLNALFKNEITRKDWILYANTPSTTGDDFKKSLRQMKVSKGNIKVRAIYSKLR
ncbi:DUF4270 family protein [Algoriphagus vanfongensis]|uniref:DUF4270 family protein n=1 Tax=Algoriphagus vanfongensis TaxID=426371 RepID=UPI001B7FBAA1|nr:DUF4270 family protein [Algoriphagus vanfongensis]